MNFFRFSAIEFRAKAQRRASICFLVSVTMIACQKKDVDIHSIKKIVEVQDLNSVEVHMPEAPGSDYFRANCMTCHSLRYIEMQPSFPRKTWEKITGKMVKSFGAPIPDTTMKHIVDYLVEVKGK
jgi:hypothetical protein